MKLICKPSQLKGTVEIPGSKSHTIRAVAIAALASGTSTIHQPLESNDTLAAVDAYSALGARVTREPGHWRIVGTGGRLNAPKETIDVGNSGTTLRIAMGSCALLPEGKARLTGDEQIQRRPVGPLAVALTDLGAQAESLNGNGCAPYEISGRLRGGETSIEAITSQYLSSLLMATPLADGDSVIRVPVLNEKPYVTITLDWLERQGITIEYDTYDVFKVPGGQQFNPVDRRIPGDFSSATFFLAAGALGDNAIISRGLDINDTQGDRAVIDYLREMGADIDIQEDAIAVSPGNLTGCEIDMNATPDALPMMAVLACFAQGTTRLVNVPQARMKETDRIAVMKQELDRLGARVEELEEGLVIQQSDLQGTTVDGRGDHRVVMSLAIAGTMASGDTTIEGAEAAAVTYPGFADALTALGGRIDRVE